MEDESTTDTAAGDSQLPAQRRRTATTVAVTPKPKLKQPRAAPKMPLLTPKTTTKTVAVR